MAIFERSEKEPVKYAFIYLTFLSLLMGKNIYEALKTYFSPIVEKI